MSPLFTVRRIALASSFSLLAACGSYDAITQKGKIDYKTTAQSKPLDIPPDLTSVTADERFVVPDVGSRGVATASGMNVGLAAGTSVVGNSGPAVLAQGTEARIERSGNQRWLVVNRPADQVWPIVREFWLQSGFVLKEDKPEIGILETDWAENRAKIPLDGVRKLVGKVFDGLYSSDELDRYRTRIERADGNTEVYISHRGLREVYADSSQVRTVWTPRASDPELEAEFLNKLLARFVGEENKRVADNKAAAASTTATAATAATATTDPRARIVRAGNERRLQVRENFDRTWRRVGLGLDRVGFTVEDRDRSKGLYFVQYRESGDKPVAKDDGKPGFFARLLSFGKDANAKPIPADEGRVEGRYRIRVAPVEGRTEVTVLNAEGQPVSAGTAEKVLGMLESELR